MDEADTLAIRLDAAAKTLTVIEKRIAKLRRDGHLRKRKKKKKRSRY